MQAEKRVTKLESGGNAVELTGLYKVINELRMFEDFEECKDCPVLCARKQNIHWLLPQEAEKLRGPMNVTKINDAHFFDGGLCPLLKEKHCSIYSERPLECRLNPLSVHEIEGELYWILYLECPIVKKRPKEEFIERLKLGITIITPFITEELKGEFRKISKAIKSFEPLIEERNFIRIAKL